MNKNNTTRCYLHSKLWLHYYDQYNGNDLEFANEQLLFNILPGKWQVNITTKWLKLQHKLQKDRETNILPQKFLLHLQIMPIDGHRFENSIKRQNNSNYKHLFGWKREKK